jgi:hypothetical protein
MALLLRTLESVQRTPSTLSFAQYREAESQNYKQSSVTSDGELLDVLTLELRVHPPNVSKSLQTCAPCASLQVALRNCARRPTKAGRRNAVAVVSTPPNHLVEDLSAVWPMHVTCLCMLNIILAHVPMAAVRC